MLATSRMTRVPALERGITIGDFLVPMVLSERIGARLRHIAMIVAGALLIALCAQLTIVQKGQTIPLLADFHLRLADSPVPITGQTFAVLLVGGALGFRRGILAVGLYLLMGLAFPVYAGGASGYATFLSSRDGSIALGATGGYLVGFLASAAAIGRLAELGWDRRVGGAITAMLIGNALVYVVGVPWLALALGVDAPTAIAYGLTPFLVVDLVKLLLAAGLFPAAWWIVGRRPGDI